MRMTRFSRTTKQAVIAAGLLFFFSFAINQLFSGDGPAEEWKAPARAAKKRNPFPPDAEALAAGKKVFIANCLACHGVNGKGDGPAAVNFSPRPKDLSDPRVSSQTDGELFWKVTEGRKPMPTYEKLITEANRWKVIDYVRTLAPPGKGPTSKPTSNPSTGPSGE